MLMTHIPKMQKTFIEITQISSNSNHNFSIRVKILLVVVNKVDQNFSLLTSHLYPNSRKTTSV